MTGLFSPYSLKTTTLRNRIMVSPMCQYMAEDGLANDWHRVHYASLARGGAGLVVVEATAVSPEGRITPHDLGLWSDEHKEVLSDIARLIKEAGAVPGIQIGHAGRKACANRPWEGDNHIPETDERSWKIISPSAIAQGGNLSRIPQEMSRDDIARVRQSFVDAARRAAEAGFEWLVLHFAHGYLAQSFTSSYANQRKDEYGGSAENRGRFLVETLKAVREVWPSDKPLTARLGVIEFDGNDETTITESIDLISRLKAEGLDFVDISMRFTAPAPQIPWGENMLVETAVRVKAATGIDAATGWFVTDAKFSDALIREGKLDMVTFARPFLQNPHWPYELARSLEIENPAQVVFPAPYSHWLSKYRSK